MRPVYFFLPAVAIALSAQSALAAERPTKALSETGNIAGADFLINIPDNWNGGLVMYAHGYSNQGSTPMFNREFATAAGTMGYAVAQSRYSRQGWAAREGVLDTEALRRYFVDKFGPAYPAIITGHSQGGAISFATIEKFPEVYDGAMPLCAIGCDSLEFFKSRVFDLRLLFDYYLPGLPGSVVDFPDGPKTYDNVKAKVEELVKANPEKAEAYRKMVDISLPQVIAPVIAFWSEILREMTERAGGNAFDNRDTMYSGSADDAALNREIPRHAADPRAVEYLRQWVSYTGEIKDPVLAIHTLVDDLIPPPYLNAYDARTAVAGTGDLYVQRSIDRWGHCSISPEETLQGLRDLDAWIRNGTRPAPGDATKK